MSERPALGEPIRHGYTGVEKRLGVARKFIDWGGDRVLDLGCGNGAYTVKIAEDAGEVVGLDFEGGRLREFRSKAAGVRNIAMTNAAGEFLPFPAGVFDTVFCIETLEHVIDERSTLKEIRRVLRPGGHVLLTVPNKWYLFETHGLRPAWMKGSNRYPFASWLPRALHARLANARIYTAGDISRLIEEAGFTQVGLDWMLPPLDKVGAAPVRATLRGLLRVVEPTRLRRLGVSIVIAAMKPAP